MRNRKLSPRLSARRAAPSVTFTLSVVFILSVSSVPAPHFPPLLSAAGQTRAQRPAEAGSGVPVFVVSGEGPDKSMDALVVVSRGQFRQPYAEQDVPAARRFADAHMRAGQKYRLIFGGGDAGTVTVKEASEGCNNIHARVSAETSANIRGRVLALATGSDSFGRRESSRRAPDEAERTNVLELARSIYRQRRTPASLLGLMQVTNLTATDLDGDGKLEMVGSFTLETKQRQRRDLFLIAAPRDVGFRADFVNFQSYKLPPEGFDSSVDFVDQLDMDGDGVGEVVALTQGFDAYGYSIYKKRRGRWSLVYSTTGDAC